jgi:formimidoylglutamate deiminase
VGLCPITEANLGDRVFPCAEFFEAGGRIGIGTDSNVSVDAAGELRQLEYSQRLRAQARNVLSEQKKPSTGRCLLDAALLGGGQALDQKVGAIAPGYRADVVVLNEAHADLAGRMGSEVLDTWVFSGGRGLVKAVVSGGEVVVEDGRHRARERIDRRYRQVVMKRLGRTLAKEIAETA